MNTYRAGIDIGSTTVKIALLDEKNNLIYGNYVRHQANTQGAMAGLLKDVREKLGDCALHWQRQLRQGLRTEKER